MKRITTLLVTYTGVVALLLVQSAAPRAAAQIGEATPNPYIDALSTQAALNTQATLAAFQQQQAASAAANAAAQAQAQAAYVAQQATQQAGQQQAALVAAQSTADAAALQATAIVQQTRTAIEFAATQQAVTVAAETTRAALSAQATRAALNAEVTRSAAEAQRRDNEAIATSVAMSIEATKVAIAAEQRAVDDRQANDRHIAEAGTLAVTIVIGVVGLLAVLLIGKFFIGVWRSRALNPKPAPAATLPIAPIVSSASGSVVDSDGNIRPATDEIGHRLAVIEYNDDPSELAQALRSLYGK